MLILTKTHHISYLHHQLHGRTNQWIVVVSCLPGSHVGLESEICEPGWNATGLAHNVALLHRWSKMPFGVVSVKYLNQATNHSLKPSQRIKKHLNGGLKWEILFPAWLGIAVNTSCTEWCACVFFYIGWSFFDQSWFLVMLNVDGWNMTSLLKRTAYIQYHWSL